MSGKLFDYLVSLHNQGFLPEGIGKGIFDVLEMLTIHTLVPV